MDRYSHTFVAMYAWNLLPIAAFLLYTGLRGIVLRKPYLIPMYWVRALLVFVFGTQFMLVYLDASVKMSAVISMTPILLIMLAIAWFGRLLRGHQIYGVTADSLRAGILSALESLGVHGEEHLGSIRVPAWNTAIEASVQPSGVGRIDIVGMYNARRLRDVVVAMNRHYATMPVATCWTQCYLSAAVGGVLAAWPLVATLHRVA